MEVWPDGRDTGTESITLMAAEQTNPVEVEAAVPPARLGQWIAEHVPGASDRAWAAGIAR